MNNLHNGTIWDGQGSTADVGNERSVGGLLDTMTVDNQPNKLGDLSDGGGIQRYDILEANVDGRVAYPDRVPSAATAQPNKGLVLPERPDQTRPLSSVVAPRDNAPAPYSWGNE